MEIKQYLQEYEGQVVDLWNRCCTFDPIDIKKFRKQALFDDNFNPELSWVALDGDKVVGYILAMKRIFPYLERGTEPERGWIDVMFVDKEYRRQGIGTKLLKLAEDKLKEMGAKNITLAAYSPSYFFWGLDPDHYPESIAFFEKHGYKGYEEHFSMGKDLHGFEIPEKTKEKIKAAEEKGYKFINFDYKYSIELLEFMKNEFGGGWKRNALMAMQNNTAEDVLFLVLNKDGKICGCCNRAIDGNPMRFGPIGIAKSERNAGLGSILLDMVCFEMCKKGIYRMFFITTDEPGRRYYERNGLTVFRRFITYKKEI
ncbi:MAG: GNAT family N-acetyltransferase [Erysipelotrichaceae bacterium]|nr:GNAT family N-acetyltransferase [Erysipelotrichaceae bacterium]